MDRAILISIFSFSFGILLSSFVDVSPLVSILLLVVGLGIYLAEKIYNQEVVREVLILSLIIISFSLGSLRYAIKDFHELITPSSTGVVVGEPEDKDNSRRFVFLSDNGERALVSTDLYSKVQYGDRVEVNGSFKTPGIIEGFNYGKYLSKDDIYFITTFAQVEVVSSGHGNKIKSALFKIKNNFIAHAKAILSEPYASLLTGLIVAGRDALPADILEEFRRAGVIHIVVLSGFNITLIATFLRKIFRSNIASVLGIILFIIMTGAGASIVRAGIMALTALGAKFLGRKYSASRTLLVAGFAMLIQNPKILVFDPSFQLSFLATLGLIYVMPIMETKLQWMTEKYQLRETLAQTLSTQITVLPLLIYSVGDISLVSIPANLLILLIVPITMLLGFIAVVLSYLGTIVALPITYVTQILLAWILYVAHALGALPFAVLPIQVNIWFPLLAYALLITYLIWKKKEGGSLGYDRSTMG